MARPAMRERGTHRPDETTPVRRAQPASAVQLPELDRMIHERMRRRARAAGMSMIPTTTGAATALALVIPELKGKMDGMAIRVPTPNVSVVDLVASLKKETTAEGMNKVLKSFAEGKLKGIMSFCEEPLVSIDFNGNPHSSIVDGPSTKVIGGKLVKIISWYDNEWGFSNRMVELFLYIFGKK